MDLGKGLGHKSDDEWLRELGVQKRRFGGGPCYSLKLPERKVQPGEGQSLLPGNE